MKERIINLLANSIELPYTQRFETNKKIEDQRKNNPRNYFPQKICDYQSKQIKKDKR